MTIKQKINICPLCGKNYAGYPAVSRVDNSTNICSACGVLEAVIPQDRKSFISLWLRGYCFSVEGMEKKIPAPDFSGRG